MVGLVAGGFIRGQRQQMRALGDQRQIFGLLLGRALFQRRGTQHGSGEHRRGAEILAHRLQDDAGRDMAHFRPAMRFRHQHAGKAHLGHLGPHIAGEAGGVLAVAQVAVLRHGGFILEEALRAVADHLLIVSEDERHEFRLPAGRARAWR